MVQAGALRIDHAHLRAVRRTDQHVLRRKIAEESIYTLPRLSLNCSGIGGRLVKKGCRTRRKRKDSPQRRREERARPHAR